MSESLSIETLIEDQKLLISKWQKEMLRSNIKLSDKQTVEALLTHCEVLENLKELSNSSEATME